MQEIKLREELTIDKLKAEAAAFCFAESKIQNKLLYGVTDGKAVGTHMIFGLGYNLLVK